ncbi:DMT family transporter [Moorena sp. SIOASIH]|uniref:DMT family transporter n=1 Tax=Moorena sp. SIOASIH TaxID=2607817 RepID=UPI0025ECFDAF|nr:DMT family transporter [Moorena sp. SIOASIH]
MPVLQRTGSVKKTSVANSNLLHNTTPIFAAVGGWLLLNQSFNPRFLIGMILALGGTFIIGFHDFNLAQDTLIGDSVALLSAFFYAATLLVTEHLLVKFEANTLLLWFYSLSSLLLLPCTLLFEDRLLPASFSGWFAVISLGLFCSLIGASALVYSLKQFSSSFVSLILLLEPIIAAFLAWLIFAEELSWLNGLTFIIVLSGIYLAKSDEELDNIGSTEAT